MLYLGIDQHARQITISLRNEQGDVIQARQVSTEPAKIMDFFDDPSAVVVSSGPGLRLLARPSSSRVGSFRSLSRLPALHWRSFPTRS